MKRSSVPLQTDLFSGVPTPPALASLQDHHDELVEFLSQLLWEAVQGAAAAGSKEAPNEQDHR